MSRKLWLALVLSLVAAFVGADAKDLLTRNGGGGVAAGSAGCSQATTFLARVPLESPTALTNLICGLVTDGVITGDLSTTGCGSKLDVFRVYAMANSTDARLNICKNAFNATTGGGGLPTFTTNAGFTGVAGSSTVYLDSNYKPSTAAGNCTIYSCSIGVWQLSSAGVADRSFGAYDSSGGIRISTIVPRSTGDTFDCVMNSDGGISVANTDGTGFYVCDRSTSTNVAEYRNGSSVNSSGSIVANGLPALNLYELGYNLNGTAIGSNAQLAAVVSGSSLSPGDVTALKNRLCTYLIAVGAVGSC